MDKSSFSKIAKYAMDCSISICNKTVPICDGSNIMPDELDWATEKGVYINYKHPIIDALSFNKQTVFVLGVITHELMHKVFSDFDVLKYGVSKYKGNYTLQRFVREIANIIEDPAIEYMAQFKIGGHLLKCLRFTIQHLYNISPKLDESHSPLGQLMSAYIQYGDIGIVKGEFTFPEAKQAFIDTIPIMDKAIESLSAKDRFIAAEQVVDKIKHLITEDADEQMDQFDEQKSQSGRSMAPQGKGAAQETLEDEDVNSSSSTSEDKKKQNRQQTKEKLSNSNNKSNSKSKKSNSEKSEEGNGKSKSGKSKNNKEKSEQSESWNSRERGKDNNNENSSGNNDTGAEDEMKKNSSPSDSSSDSENKEDKSSNYDESDDSSDKNTSDAANSNSDNADSNSDTDSQSDSDKRTFDMNEMIESHRQPVDKKLEDITSGDGIGLKEGTTTFDENIYEISEEDIKTIMDEIKDNAETEEHSESYEDELEELSHDAEDIKEFQLKVENKQMTIDGNIDVMQNAYYQVINEVGDIIHMLNKNLKKIFRQDVENREYTTTGRVSMKRLSSGRQTARVFEKVRQPKNKQQMKVCVLVDESGSMSGEKAKTAKKTAIILAEVFGKLDIPLSVMGFTTNLNGYQINHHHYLHWDNTVTNRLKLLNISSYGCNYDALAVRTAAKMMKKKKSVYDLLIIISDGEPSFGLGKRGERFTDLAFTIKNTRKQVKNIIGIGLGNINTKAFENFYGNDFVHVYNIKDLPIELSNAIKRIVKKW